MKEKTKRISSWDELLKFCENVNPYNQSIYLSGWIKEVDGDRAYIRELLFTTMNLDILIKNKEEKSKKKVVKK